MESSVHVEPMAGGFIVADYSGGHEDTYYHGPHRKTRQPAFRPDEVFPSREAAEEYVATMATRGRGAPLPSLFP